MGMLLLPKCAGQGCPEHVLRGVPQALQVAAGRTFWGQEWQQNLTAHQEAELGISQEVPKDIDGAQLWKTAQEQGIGARNFIEKQKVGLQKPIATSINQAEVATGFFNPTYVEID